MERYEALNQLISWVNKENTREDMLEMMNKQEHILLANTDLLYMVFDKRFKCGISPESMEAIWEKADVSKAIYSEQASQDAYRIVDYIIEENIKYDTADTNKRKSTKYELASSIKDKVEEWVDKYNQRDSSLELITMGLTKKTFRTGIGKTDLAKYISLGYHKIYGDDAFQPQTLMKGRDFSGDKIKDLPKWMQDRLTAYTTKIDGHRAGFYVVDGEYKGFYTYQKKKKKAWQTIESKIKAFATLIKNWSGKDTFIIDGENGMFLDDDKWKDMHTYCEPMGSSKTDMPEVAFFIFDLVFDNETPYKERQDILQEYVEKAYGTDYRTHLNINIYDKHNVAYVVPYYTQSFDVIQQEYQSVIDAGGEGLMLRDAHGVYENKKTVNMGKMKPKMDLEVVVTGVVTSTQKVPGKNELETVAAGFTYEYYGNEFVCGMGISWEKRKEWCKDPSKIVGKTVTIRYSDEKVELDGKRHLKYPSYKGVRTDA